MRRQSSLHAAIRLCVVLLLVAFGPSSAKNASAQVGPDVEDPWNRTRELYRQGDWQNALRYATEAAQRDPDEPRYYLAIARIHFYLQNFERAIWFYDTFLELTETLGVDYPDASSRERARGERISAQSRLADRSAPIEEPTTFRQVREAFIERLDAGPAVEGSSGGAWGTFQSLLRVGYAAPDLAELRARFEEAARAEGMAIFEEAAPTLPALSAEAWRAQLVRFAEPSRRLPAPLPFDGGAASTEPELDEGERERLAYVALIDGQLAYLRQSYAQATTSFREATELTPQNTLAWCGLMNALLAQRQTAPRELRQALAEMLEHVDEAALRAFYQAAVYEQSGDSDDAARTLADAWWQHLRNR